MQRKSAGRGMRAPGAKAPPKQEIAATAAPWRYELCPAELNARVIGAGGNLVAVVWSGKRPSLETVEANARIVAAAPDTLAALERFARAMEQRSYPELQGIANDAFQAIRVARGGA